MDVSRVSSPSQTGSDLLGGTLAVQRERVHGFLAAQRERVQRIEAELSARIEQCRIELTRQQEELDTRRAKLDEAEQALAQRQLALEHERGQQDAQRAQMEGLRETLSRRSADLDARQEQIEALRSRTEEQRRRIVRDLRARRQALLTQPQRREPDSKRQPPSKPAPAEPAGRLSWEAEKERIMAALESEDNGSQTTVRRTEIEEVIRVTEDALAEKDREIEEMKQVLDSQASNIGQVAVGAVALGEILDKDALIREERENLKRLQQQWEEKLRRAEIEISLERAKLARGKAELEEKLHTYEHHRQTAEAQSSPPGAKPARGRWLARLGIKDDPPES